MGLGHDYASLGGADSDKYEVHLRNLLTQQFGGSFVASKVRISFPTVSNEEVCQVDVGPAKDPVILTVKDKNGVAMEKFHVRSGNSSPELPLSELNAYWATRFAA